MQKVCLLLAIVLLFAGASKVVFADIVNGGFETGDFQGWNAQSTVGQGDGVRMEGYYSTKPYEGSYMASLNSCSLAPYSSQSCSLTQIFSANAGDILSFRFLYDRYAKSDMNVAEAGISITVRNTLTNVVDSVFDNYCCAAAGDTRRDTCVNRMTKCEKRD